MYVFCSLFLDHSLNGCLHAILDILQSLYMILYISSYISKGLFTWSGGPRSGGVSFFCFHALGDTKQKKLTPLDRGPPLHVNRV